MDISKILLIIKIIYYLCKYDIEVIKVLDRPVYSIPVYKSNRFVNIFILDNRWLLKQFHEYEKYAICNLVQDNINLLFLNKNSFGYKFIVYCISLIPKWVSLENRLKVNFSVLPKIYDLDKKTLSYKEEYIKTILRYDCYYTIDRIHKIIKTSLSEFSIRLGEANMVFVFLERKNMCITRSGKLKIIEGEVWSVYQFNTIKQIVNKWCPDYKFINYDNYPNIYS